MEDEYIAELQNELLSNIRRCRICNFCLPSCPLLLSSQGPGLQGPAGIMQSIYYSIVWGLTSSDRDIEDLKKIVYSCTTCHQCATLCRALSTGVPTTEVIETGRKLLVEKMIGPMNEHIGVLESLEQNGNPYGEPASGRIDWLYTLEKDERGHCKVLEDSEKTEVLIFVGCTASYDPQTQEIAKALVKIFEKLDMPYGILKNERCCASPAKRIGEEGLFQEMAAENTELFLATGAKLIVTISPHCFNTFINEYPEQLRSIRILHYTQFLAEKMEEGLLKPAKKMRTTTTYHDPCYLGRKNAVYDEPRRVIEIVAEEPIKEMRKSRENGLCCGGGGGRMWVDFGEEKKVSELRLEEALSTGASIIATACPWCQIQLEDAVKSLKKNGAKIVSIAQLVADSL